jgi:hypothetical protein
MTGRQWKILAASTLLALSANGCARQPVAVPAHPAAAPAATARPAQAMSATGAWTFAVSGDSRNCGNLVMPAIAAGARADHAAVYWHLGDLRAIYKADEDYVLERRFRAFTPPPSINDYLHTAWTDFLQHQVVPFGDLPFFLGIGNHELIAPKTNAQFLIEFAPLLDRAELRAQRERDAPLLARIRHVPMPRTYYHWVERGVDFINLDNATGDAFDVAQLVWFDAVLDQDLADPAVTTIVVGMHESLPYSLSDNHSMCGTLSGRESGKHVYARLAAARGHKHVYVLSSHSHYYLENIYDTDHWRDPENGGVVLPGWVVGTAGASRYPLPPGVEPGPGAREHVYGYLLGTVAADGAIEFAFKELGAAELQAALTSDYAPEDAAFCVAGNPDIEQLQRKRAQSPTCEESMVR